MYAERTTYGLRSATYEQQRADYNANISEFIGNLFGIIPLFFRIILFPFKWVIESIFTNTNNYDKNNNNNNNNSDYYTNYDVEISDRNRSDGEIYNILREIGARFDEIKKLYNNDSGNDDPWVFNESSSVFEKETASVKEFEEFTKSIIEFCASFYILGTINPLALTNTILASLKQLKYENERILVNKEIIEVLFTNQNSRMGVLKLKLDGYQELNKYCCYNATKTKLTIKKTCIVFHDVDDLKLLLKRNKKLRSLNLI